MDDLPRLFDQIAELIAADATQPSAERLAEIERTLTDGYARALALEGERWRLERKIGELARTIDTTSEARELNRLADRLLSAEGELDRLRGVLGRLRDHAEAVRTALPVH